ncbi:S-adenosylmethionine decarboxylase [Candidatus Pacearchaeota archaeon]|nr:S-adenosylmethionine decarboxylase [Candidatus Pacearchaeota archaeon]
MKEIAPQIMRQRLLVEGFYKISVNKKTINRYFNEICKYLKLKMYGKPIIFSPGGEGKKINQGYDAFVPLIDSGISVYIWSNAKFFSLIIYTCKRFDEKKALTFTKKFFKLTKFIKKTF